MRALRSDYPVTDELLNKLDSYIQRKGLSLFAKVYKTFAERLSGEPEVFKGSADTIWDMVLQYAGAFEQGGCLEICTKEDNEEYVVFFLQDGEHHIPQVDVDLLLRR